MQDAAPRAAHDAGMIKPADLRTAALALPQTVEAPHFDARAFCVGKKIFATLGEAEGRAVVKLTAEQQDMLCAAAPAVYAPVKGYWGGKGWTLLSLAAAERRDLGHALRLAWSNVAPRKLVSAMPAPSERRVPAD